MEHNPEVTQYVIKARDAALESVRQGGGPFGAVIVREGEILSLGMNTVTRNMDPTAHAEINAIREAARKLGHHNLSGCEIYCSCEPCPMCMGAIYWARLDRMYYANTISVAAKFGFDDSLILEEFILPPSDRSIPAIFVDIEQPQLAFRHWEIKADKIRY